MTEDGCPEYLRRTIACLPLLVRKLANLELLICKLLSTGRNAEDHLSVKHCCQLELTLRSLEEAIVITTSIVRRMGPSSSVLEPLVDRIEPTTAIIAHSTRLARFHVAWPSEKTCYLLSKETLMQEMRTSSMRALSEFEALERQKQGLDVVARELGDIVLKKWQRDLLLELQGTPHPRKIVWMVDEKGNTGKTYLSKYLLTQKKAVRFENGPSADIK